MQPGWASMTEADEVSGTAGPSLPAGKGTYALVVRLETPCKLNVGKLGLVELPAGYCLYFGSALGGLAGRIQRHLRRRKKLWWHIDYLTRVAAPEEVWWNESRGRAECDWAAAGLLLPGATTPAPGFGASDCRCSSHLVHVPERPFAEDFRRALGPGQAPSIGVLRTARTAPRRS